MANISTAKIGLQTDLQPAALWWQVSTGCQMQNPIFNLGSVAKDAMDVADVDSR